MTVLVDIPGFEGRYVVSKDGRIFSLLSMAWLSPTVDAHGYAVVSLHGDGVRVQRRVHRIVAGVWVPNPQNLPQVNHIDGVKLHNAAGNLEWCDAAHNVQHAYDNGLARASSPKFIESVRRNAAKARAAKALKYQQRREIA